MHRIVKVAVSLSVATLALSSCGKSADDAPSGDGSGSAAGGVKVGMAYDVGGRGDQSFNDAAAAGLDKAKAELGVQGQESTAQYGEAESAREERLQQLIDKGFTNIVAVGFAYAPAVQKVAKENQDVKFAVVDSADAKGPNIQNIVFAEQEGSYLAGVVAASRTRTNKVGFVGGVQTDLIKKFEKGFTAGAKATKPNITVRTQYISQPPDVSGFADPAKGKAAADGMLQQGTDVVYHAAGASGTGVFTAVKKANKMAIGVDSDQYKKADPSVRDVIITSMVKRVDVGVFEFIKQAKDGKVKSGEQVYDLKSHGVALATTGGRIDDLEPKIAEVTKQIVDGKVTVPSK